MRSCCAVVIAITYSCHNTYMLHFGISATCQRHCYAEGFRTPPCTVTFNRSCKPEPSKWPWRYTYPYGCAAIRCQLWLTKRPDLYSSLIIQTRSHFHHSVMKPSRLHLVVDSQASHQACVYTWKPCWPDNNLSNNNNAVQLR